MYYKEDLKQIESNHVPSDHAVVMTVFELE